MKIKEVCEKTSLTERAVRLYIENGLIAPSVSESYSGRRNVDFSPEDVEKLKPIISELSKTHRIYAESMGKYRDNPETWQSMLDMGYNVFMGNKLYDFLAMVKERHFS